jgi:predicted dehydrogenase
MPRLPEADPGRREFLRRATLGVGAAVAGVASGGPRAAGAAPADRDADFVAPALPRVRIGFVGVGDMGMVHVGNLLRIEGAELRAVCDIVPEKVTRAQAEVEAAGQPRPRGYSRGPRDFERMIGEEELDLVYNATPWEWHVPISLAAMRNGRHAVTEVPAAVTIDDCWDLVETAEKTRRYCIMMENCCYGQRELAVLNMARRGVLGELLHAECGYLHDLREIKFASEGEGLWRRAHSRRRNGNLYPTHGLGPVAQCLDVNRGDRLDHLVSMSSSSRGLRLYAAEHFPDGDPRRAESFALGDVNLSLLRTVRGRTIVLSHNCDNPRPYSRVNLVQGTRGIVSGYPDRVYIEGRGQKHKWTPLEDVQDEFEHPFWKLERVRDEDSGHGGMDFLEDWRLISALVNGLPMDLDVYDAATWSCISELTEKSVAKRSKRMDVPDFTRGRWRRRPPLGIATAIDAPAFTA